MTRSRLRRPTSKSMATVFLPVSAMPVATLALVVVFPTPPLPEVTTTTLDTAGLPFTLGCSGVRFFEPFSIGAPFRPRAKFFAVSERRDPALAAVEIDLGGLAAPVGGDLVGHDVRAGDGHQLGLELLAEDARAEQARGARDGAP